LNAQTSLHFSGLDWTVRSGGGGPGPNNWSDDPGSVWVDTSGFLHMKIHKTGDTWYCSEIYASKSFGYGEYRFDVISDVEQYDPNVVVGLFSYESDEREIDIEFSRWANPGNVAGWYTVQPAPYNATNQDSFALALNGSPSTHLFRWSADSIFFKSSRPYTITVPPTDSLICQWTYTGNNNPPVGNERLHINFWLFHGNPPQDLQEEELVIKAVQVPSPASIKPYPSHFEEVKVYPNPAMSMMFVQIEEDVKMQELTIFNAEGQQIESLCIHDPISIIDVSRFEAGIYYLRFDGPERSFLKKFAVFRFN